MDRRSHWLVYCLSTAVLVGGLLILSAWVAKSNCNRAIGVRVESGPQGLLVVSVTKALPASRAGLQEGDLLRTVAGRKVAVEEDYQTAARTFQAGRPVEFEIDRKGVGQVLSIVPGTSFPWAKFNLNVLAALSYLIIGVLTLKRSPGYLRSGLLSLFCAAVAVELAVTAFPPIGFPRFSFLLLCLYYSLTGIQFGLELHLASVFPDEQPWLKKRPWVIYFFYVIGTTTAVLACLAQLADFWRVELPWSTQGLGSFLAPVGFSIWAIVLLSLLGRSMLLYPGSEGRKEAGILLLGILPWAFYILASSLLEIFNIVLPSWSGMLETYVLLTYPGSILYVLWREASEKTAATIDAYRSFQGAESTADLLERVAQVIEVFHPRVCYIWSPGERTKGRKLIRITEDGRMDMPFDGLAELTRSVGLNRRIVDAASLVGALPDSEREVLERYEIELIVPISDTSRRLSGILLLTRKFAGDVYTPEDLVLMASIASHALAGSTELSKVGGETAETVGGNRNVLPFPLPCTHHVFVSYSRDDLKERDWIKELETHFTPLRKRRNDDVCLWYDRLIGSGKSWKDEIDKGLKDAGAAILLVGPGFLDSTFIMETELPGVLEARRSRGLNVYPVLISFCDFQSALGELQFVNQTDQPLNLMPTGEQDRILGGLVAAIETAIVQGEKKAQVP